MKNGNGYSVLASELLAAGLCVVPATKNKHPRVSENQDEDKWQRYQTSLPIADELEEWFVNRHPFGIGIVCGLISGGLEVLDLDAKHDPTGTLNTRAEAAIKFHAPGLWERLPIESTPTGGLHLYFRCALPAKNVKLAHCFDANGKAWAVAETRGEGGFIMSAPSPGYLMVQGRLADVPVISDDERNALFAAARTLGDAPVIPKKEPPRPVATMARTDFPAGFVSPGDAYNQAEDWRNLLLARGWTERNEHQWRRPGKADGNSANWDTLADCPRHLYVFTSNAHPLEDGTAYSPFSLYAHLECSGDFKLAADRLYDMNFGTRRKPRIESVSADVQAELDAQNESEFSDKPEPAREFPGERFLADVPRELAKAEQTVRGPTITPRPITSFLVPPDDDPSILLGNRYLCRGDGLVVVSSSGMGKSALSIQAAVTWCLGKPFMGIKPNGKLRSLIMQSEDSDGDIGEVWASICHKMRLTDEEKLHAAEYVVVVSDRVHRGPAFLSELKLQVAAEKYDLVWINPLAAFMSGDGTTQETAGEFLRGGLNGINNPPSFGYIIIQHTTKPVVAAKGPERKWNEVMYDMAGSYDIVGWARSIISLRPADNIGEFNMVLAKRGPRAGVTKKVPQGIGFRLESTTVIPLKHSTEKMSVEGIKRELSVIFWEPREVSDAPQTAPEKGGRPKQHTLAPYLPLLPTQKAKALGFTDLLKIAKQIRPISSGSFFGLIQEAVEVGVVKVDDSNPSFPRYYKLASDDDLSCIQ